MSMQDEGAAQVKGRSPGVKFIIVAAMTLAMVVPLVMIGMTLASREESSAAAAADIASSWGRAQTLSGIYLIIPYTETVTAYDPNTTGNHQQIMRHSITVLPSRVAFATGARTEIRSRGIYDSTVYTADVAVDAQFDSIDTSAIPTGADILWSEAVAVIGLSDARALNRSPVLSVGGRTIAFEPGTGEPTVAFHAIHARLGLTAPPGTLAMKTALAVRGTSELTFVPIGRDTTVTVRSGWPSPSFYGAFLPIERQIGAGGFSATWSVPYLARGFGAINLSDNGAYAQIMQSAFGVKFFQPVDFYQLVERSLKYAILVIGLTFLTFFIFELVAGARLHFIQYAMIGTAQVMFYLLLLSFAEQVGFDIAYALGAFAVVGLTTAYGISALGGIGRAALLGGILTAVYGALYCLLQVEDYALLVGSLFLFAVLAVTMYLTRNIDWYRGFALARG